jgi:tRNA-2-methylthio-N6-dimethylallyladenosine synthase
LNGSSRKKLYIETYGCQMNVYDSELVVSIMIQNGYELVDEPEQADAIFVNTCSVRENAEQRVWGQLTHFKNLKINNPDLIIGVLGCMAKNLEEGIHQKRPYVNLILGPDSYRKLPELLDSIKPYGSKMQMIQQTIPVLTKRNESVSDYWIDTRLSRSETYDGIFPHHTSRTTAWIAIMRGCNNYCTFCVVPYTRGRERSRTIKNIRDESIEAVQKGFTEIFLLGQNVNSYKDGDHDFAFLMEQVSKVDGVRRIRFISSHPKDFPKHLLKIIADHDTICKHIHLPVQSGSNRILEMMNRTYSREDYLRLIDNIRMILPDVAITSDVIVGFPSETDKDHEDTLNLFRSVEFDAAFTFAYSPRPGTKAYNLTDDVTAEVKTARLSQVIDLQRHMTEMKLKKEVGTVRHVLIEEESKKSAEFYAGRTGKSQTVILPKGNKRIGEYADVRITHAEGHTLFGQPL